MRVFLVLLLAATVGCASLALKDSDSGRTKAKKIGTRVVLGVATFGFSELSIDLEVEKERREARAKREQAYVDGLYRQIREYRQLALEADSAEEAERYLAIHDRVAAELSGYLERDQAARAAAAAILGTIIQKQRSCTSTLYGNTVRTDCH